MRGYRFAANFIKGMAHPVRLAILQILREDGECCVCHLEHTLGQRQAYISQQLARLREANLVTDRREGLNVYYALSEPDVAGLVDAAIELTRSQASAQGEDIAFEIARSDHRETCPCPKCTGEFKGTELALEEKR